MTNKKLVSIVVPVFNEEANILPLYEAVIPIINQYRDVYNFEIIFTDNHSTDNTFIRLRELRDIDRRVKVFRFSRNFGYQRSILTGCLQAKGDSIIQLDCDLQDPPELIPEFLKYWEEGCEVVYGIRRSRQENTILHVSRKIFYRLINYLSEDELPIDVGDFRLIDRKLIDVMQQFDDAQPYLRGMVASMGFRQRGVLYDRRVRERGKSNFGFKDLIGLAMDGILNHSIIPLRLATFFGLGVSLLTIFAIIFYSGGKLIFGFDWPAGFTTLTVLVLSGMCVNALFLGIIGEYIGRIFQQVKRKPLVIFQEKLND
jgi:glycosyltransferase involved in cell wall biosynthesis